MMRWRLALVGVASLLIVQLVAAGGAHASTHAPGLGAVLTSADGGQIFGWDLDMSGTDGVLTTSTTVGPNTYKVSVETFDQTTATITGSFANITGKRDSFLGDGIFAGDIGLITHYVTPPGSIFPRRHYVVMNPVSGGRVTGQWVPPVKEFDVLQHAENQSTSTSVLYGLELRNAGKPAIVSTDLATGTSSLFELDPNTFGPGNVQVSQDSATNQAVLATSTGAVGGPPPINWLLDLSTGDLTSFPGLNNGVFGAGFVNGLAVDSTTGIACTTTELNAQVEFYDLARQQGIAVQLPGTTETSQLNSGAAVAVDEVNHLFLVADPVYAPTGDSAIVVYDEHGHFIEAITGFSFSNAFRVVPVRVAVNPATRTGYVEGAEVDQLQQFFY